MSNEMKTNPPHMVYPLSRRTVITAIATMLLATKVKAIPGQSESSEAQPVPGSKASPPIGHLGPIGISVRNLDRSARFYAALSFVSKSTEKLPHAVAKALGSKKRHSTVVRRTLSNDKLELSLFQFDPLPTEAASTGAVSQLGLAHLEFYVDDVDRMGLVLQQNGGTVIRETRARLTDVGEKPFDVLFCRDPDGTLILLTCDHEPTTKLGVGPIGVSVSDLQQSAEFYGKLGFEVTETIDFPQSAAKAMGSNDPGASFSLRSASLDGTDIFLLQLKPTPPAKTSPGVGGQFGLGHLEFIVNDVELAAARIAQSGGTVLNDTRTQLTLGAKSIATVFGVDPNGALVRLITT